MLTDHGFLRAAFQNFHWVDEQMARANQPAPKHIARYAAMGFKTIINLRGEQDSGYFALEREACERHKLALVNVPLGSREPPSKARIHRAQEIFAAIEYPALMHCKSGADRAGLMAALYLHFHKGAPIAAAMDQLSLRYLHVKQGKTGMLDFFLQSYLAYAAQTPIAFIDWVDTVYNPEDAKAQFRAQWWGTLITERILRRE